MRDRLRRWEYRVVIGPMTQTIRVQRLLRAAAVETELVKADNEREGCAYALAYPAEQDDTVRVALRNAGIAPRAFLGGRG